MFKIQKITVLTFFSLLISSFSEAQVVCGMDVVETSSLALFKHLQNRTYHNALDPSKKASTIQSLDEYVMTAMTEGTLDQNCYQAFSQALQCCGHPENQQCGVNLGVELPILTGTAADAAELARTLLRAQNIAVVKAYQCGEAKTLANSKCFNSPIAFEHSKEFEKLEHLFYKEANENLNDSCRSTATYNSQISNGSQSMTILCARTKPYICNTN